MEDDAMRNFGRITLLVGLAVLGNAASAPPSRETAFSA